jgi:hypothetical protein
LPVAVMTPVIGELVTTSVSIALSAADCTAGVDCAPAGGAVVFVDFRQPPHSAAAMNINHVVLFNIA